MERTRNESEVRLEIMEMVRWTIIIPKPVRDGIREIARKGRRYVSAVAEEALTDYLKKGEGKNERETTE